MVSQSVTENDLHAYVDGELDVARRIAVEAYLAEDQDAAVRVAGYRAQGEALHGLFDQVLSEPADRETLDLRRRLAARLSGNGSVRRGAFATPLMRLAASVVLLVAGGAGGYLLKPAITPLASLGGAPIQASATLPAQVAVTAPAVPAAATNADVEGRPGMEAFAEAAARAHTFYTGESRFPVEMGGEDRGALDSWLSERLGKSVFGPDLSSLGYKLIGGRSMPTATGVGAQYMYENEAKHRLTLFVGAPHSSQETSFSFIQHGEVGMFYWTEGSLAYVLIGQLGHDELMAIAKAVYQDLKDHPAERPAQHDAAPAAQPTPAQQPAPPPAAQPPGGGIQPASDVKPKAS